MYIFLIFLSMLSVVCNATEYDCVILGSGPAGLSAALYTTQAHIATAVIAENFGQLTGSHRVENFPGAVGKSGFDIIETLQEQVKSSGTVDFINDRVVSVDFSRSHSSRFQIVTRDNGLLEAKSVIIATGSSPKKLGIPGEEQWWGYGVSSCAVCDGFLYQDKDVIVIGGGNSAIEQALQLVGYARSVTMIVRSSALRATPHEKIKLCEHKEKISVMYDTVITEIFGDSQHGVTGVQLYNTVDATMSHMSIDGVFLAIGHIPNTSLFSEWITLDESGHIELTTRSQETNIRGVFAAGDVADPDFKQAAKAAGDGVQAALEAIDFVRFGN